MPRVAIVFGTRPEYIKLALIIRRLKEHWPHTEVLVTGQHYDGNMTSVFMRELEIPSPDVSLHCTGETPTAQTASILTGVARYLARSRPKLVLTLGDTNTTLAASLAAVQNRIPVCHVEAGCRCYDMTMPEEVNRRVVDSLSALWCAPTDGCKANLVREGIDERHIHVVGYTQGEVWQRVEPLIDSQSVLDRTGVKAGGYVLMTIHRQENVDEPSRLAAIVNAVECIDMPVIWVVHPRTRKRIGEYSLRDRIDRIPSLNLKDPLGYIDFMSLLSKAAVSVTDSGGVQTEAALLRVPAVIVRERTEQPECVQAGAAVLVGRDPRTIPDCVSLLLQQSPAEATPAQVYPQLRSSELVLRALDRFI